MTLPNNTAAVSTAFKALTTAQIGHEKASGKIITTLRKEGVNTAADIAKGGRYIAAFMEGVAQAVLTPAQFKTWADTSLATKANGKLTSRGELMTRVSSRAAKVRAEFAKALAAPAEKRGPSERKTFDQVMLVQIDAWVKRIVDNKDKDSFNMDADPIEVKAALMAVAKILR